MFTTEENEVVMAADQVAAIVEGRGENSYVGVTKVTSVRLPLHLSVKLQALAHKSGKTRNAMMVNLLEVGLEEVYQRLSPETVEQLQELESEALSDQAGEA